jgi:hypothetical protein
MNYEIRKIKIPFETGKIIEFQSENLSKLIEVKPLDEWWAPDLEAAKKSGDYTKVRQTLSVVVLERWGSEKFPNCTHKLVILKEGQPFELTLNYEPILSRRGKFQAMKPFNFYAPCYIPEDFYVFQV